MSEKSSTFAPDFVRYNTKADNADRIVNQEILRKEYHMIWRSPQDINPEWNFDLIRKYYENL